MTLAWILAGGLYLAIGVVSFFVLMPLLIDYWQPDDSSYYAEITFVALCLAAVWPPILVSGLLYLAFAEIGRWFDTENDDISVGREN